MRGRTIICFIMDEAEFFTSSGGDSGKDYTVNDRDIFRALKPRLLKTGKGMLISTPWPVETLMGEMFEANWAKCINATAIKAPTLLVRGDDPDIAEMVEDELRRDPENARRELFCEIDGFGGGEFFDAGALGSAVNHSDTFPLKCNSDWPVAVGCDLGFTSDSSAIVVVQFDGRDYCTMYAEELRPKPGKPLKPSVVIGHFAEIAKRYGATGVVADSYYRQAFKEQLQDHGLVVFDAPEGVKGKADVFQRTRAVLHEGHCKLPESPIVRRLVQQAKTVTSRAAPGGQVTIRVPRKIGLGHGDLVSAWTLAVHRLAWASIEKVKPTYEPGSVQWNEESHRRLVEFQKKQQDQYLAKTQKEVKRSVDERRLHQFLAPRD